MCEQLRSSDACTVCVIYLSSDDRKYQMEASHFSDRLSLRYNLPGSILHLVSALHVCLRMPYIHE